MGTTVDVGWWGLDDGRPLADPNEWHHVAPATLASVELSSDVNRSDLESKTKPVWVVILTNVEAE